MTYRNAKTTDDCRKFYAWCRDAAVKSGRFTTTSFNEKVKGDVAAFGAFERSAGIDVNEPRLFAWHAHVAAFGYPPK